MAQNRKSEYCTSAMGRMPIMAAPSAAPIEPGLRDGGVHHPVGELLLQPEGHGERAAPAPGDPDVLPDAEHPRVPAHLLRNAFPQRLRDSQPLPAHTNMSSSASSGRGSGSAMACCTAASTSAFTSSRSASRRFWSQTLSARSCFGRTARWARWPPPASSPPPAGKGTGRAASGR